MDKSTIKEHLKKYYNEEAPVRDGKGKKAEWKIKEREKFRDVIAREGKKTLLELGPGAGYDSLFFMENGFDVTAVDLSPEMVRCCREKGINAYELDFYNLSALGKRFDSIYSINSLLHTPKSDFPGVLGEIRSTLNDGGLFYMGLYGGDDRESEFVKSDVSETPRYFVFHSEKYLKDTLSKCFDIVCFETLTVGDSDDIQTFFSVIMKKKTE